MMKKYKVTVSIIGSRFLGVMEAENMNDISKKVRKEGLAFDGICDDCIDRLDLGVDEVLVEEIKDNNDVLCDNCLSSGYKMKMSFESEGYIYIPPIKNTLYGKLYRCSGCPVRKFVGEDGVVINFVP